MVKHSKLILLTGIFALLVPSLISSQASAFIFLGPDLDTSMCANIGSSQHGVRTYPSDWPKFAGVPYEGGLTNWFCRAYTETTYSTFPSYRWTSTIPVGTPVIIGKQDIESYAGTGTFSNDLAKVEWDLDGNGSYEVVDTGPWITAQGTQREQVDSTVTEWTTRARYFETTFVPTAVGTTTLRMRVTHSDSSVDLSTGTFTAVADTATAKVQRGVGPALVTPVLEGEKFVLSAGYSTSASSYFSKYEWDLNGDGIYEIDGGSVNTYSTSFASSGVKTAGVKVTSRGGLTSTATTSIEVRKAPPSGEPGVSIIDGASFTNSRAVQLNLVWPNYATEARISNDGGFAASKTKTLSLASSVDWELDDSVKGIYTKVVYVRFNGSGIDTTKTYSDDIILDTTAPIVESSSAAAASGSIDVTLKATDDITGVDKVQIRNGATTVTKDYNTKISVSEKEIGLTVSASGVKKMASASIEVSVSDKAGNWSAFKTLSVAGILTTTTSTSTIVTQSGAMPKVTTSKSTTAKSIASFAKIKVLATSKVSLKIVPSSAKYCKVSGNTLKGLKTGSCKVTVTVTPKKGRATSKTVTLKVSK